MMHRPSYATFFTIHQSNSNNIFTDQLSSAHITIYPQPMSCSVLYALNQHRPSRMCLASIATLTNTYYVNKTYKCGACTDLSIDLLYGHPPQPAMPSSQSAHPKVGNKENAERLKAQGNALHVKGQYKAAYKKYSEAIKEDPTNAVLWSNRAASGLAMKEYLDAAHDAEKAVGLDPKYAKAWGRVGSARMALSHWSKCAEAWNTALSCLPPEGEMTPEHKALKVQFESGLKKIQDLEAEAQSVADGNMKVMNIADVQNKLPWQRGLAMEKEIVAKQHNTCSAFVIMNAYRDFSEGVELMKQIKIRQIGDKETIEGALGALVQISNGILRDKRVFHVDTPDWFDKYNRQVELECGSNNAWNTGGARLVQEDVLRRLKASGWDPVRRALSSTIR